ncbi:MAG: hypothetical protein WD768_18970 [Phycisphaeraceae bacterium]
MVQRPAAYRGGTKQPAAPVLPRKPPPFDSVTTHPGSFPKTKYHLLPIRYL